MCAPAPKPWHAIWERFEWACRTIVTLMPLTLLTACLTFESNLGCIMHENNGHNPPLGRPRTCRATIKDSQVSSQSGQESGSSRETKTQVGQKGRPAGQKASQGREGFFSQSPQSCGKVGACPQRQTAQSAPRESSFPQAASANKTSFHPPRSPKGNQPQAACQAIHSNRDNPEHAIGGARLSGMNPWSAGILPAVSHFRLALEEQDRDGKGMCLAGSAPVPGRSNERSGGLSIRFGRVPVWMLLRPRTGAFLR